jgi:molybdate transport system substrate-binding protein
MPMRFLRSLALCVSLASAAAAAAQPLTVSAAASLQDAFRDIGKAFVASHPGVELNFNFASSGLLLAQIAQGAPVDVFACADLETMDRALAQRLVDPDTRVNFAANELVLVSPLQRPASLKALPDLTRADIRRIALGNTGSVPAGRYARGALQQLRLWNSLTPKLVFADSVRQALNYVSRAEVDAAFVYRTDALLDPQRVRIDFAVPTADAVLYPMARVAASKNAAVAGEFIAFVVSAPGQAVLARHGFARP